MSDQDDVFSQKIANNNIEGVSDNNNSHEEKLIPLDRIKDEIVTNQFETGCQLSRDPPQSSEAAESREVKAFLDDETRCQIHCREENKGNLGWVEMERTNSELPNVIVSIPTLTEHIHSLLKSHGNRIPLLSLQTCYEHEFGKLNVVAERDGVPLEHLVTCVPNVRIVKSTTGLKGLEWMEKEEAVSHPLECKLDVFSREMTSLLKNEPFCRIAFTEFIPAYRRHFDRKFCVADYSSTNLLDLFEAVAHVVQILGNGNRRMLTLTHRAQVKRLTSDVLYLLISQGRKQIALTDLSDVYEKSFGKPFEIFNYGVCDIMDMFSEKLNETIVVKNGPKGLCITTTTAIKFHFFNTVLEFLCPLGYGQMPLSKFCKQYEEKYGFECEISQLLNNEKCNGLIQITRPQSSEFIGLVPRHLLIRDIAILLYEKGHLPVKAFQSAFASKFGRKINPEEHGHPNLLALLNDLPKMFHIRRRSSFLVCVNKLNNPYLKGHLATNTGKAKLSANKQNGDAGSLQSSDLQPVSANETAGLDYDHFPKKEMETLLPATGSDLSVVFDSSPLQSDHLRHTQNEGTSVKVENEPSSREGVAPLIGQSIVTRKRKKDRKPYCGKKSTGQQQHSQI